MLYNFFVDDFGRIWKGPVAPLSTMHYALFHGFTNPAETIEEKEIWVLERSSPSDEWEKIPHEKAGVAIERFKTT